MIDKSKVPDPLLKPRYEGFLCRDESGRHDLGRQMLGIRVGVHSLMDKHRCLIIHCSSPLYSLQQLLEGCLQVFSYCFCLLDCKYPVQDKICLLHQILQAFCVLYSLMIEHSFFKFNRLAFEVRALTYRLYKMTTKLFSLTQDTRVYNAINKSIYYYDNNTPMIFLCLLF